jgi:hypothetical protein
MNKEGYQPIKTKKTTKIIPPNTGSNVQMKKDGYSWEDLDRSYWEGFDNAKNKMEKRIEELEAQIEKLIDFVISKTECCDVCPITDTCINSEGTCPYAGILSKGEEAVTREWLMQKIAKEIKEK